MASVRRGGALVGQVACEHYTVWSKATALVDELGRLRAPLLGVFGANDPQIPAPVVDKFREALASAGVEHDVVSYENVGHAFWSDMGQVEREESPQIDAYKGVTTNAKNAVLNAVATAAAQERGTLVHAE